MFNNAIDRLSSILTDHVFVANVCPVLGFAAVDGLAFYASSERFRLVVRPLAKGEGGVIGVALVAVVVLVTTALLLSASEPFLRRSLEGKGWPRFLDAVLPRMATAVGATRPQSVETRLLGRQRARLEALRAVLKSARLARRALRRKASTWTERLRLARERGSGQHAAYTSIPELEELDRAHASGRLLQASDFEPAVNALEKALAVTDAQDPTSGDGRALDDDNQVFMHLLSAAESAMDLEYTRSSADLEARFGAGEQVESTAIGNLATTPGWYAMTRYGIDFDRLQGVFEQALNADESFSKRLEATRVELSFLISCTALSAVSCLVGVGTATWNVAGMLGDVVSWWPMIGSLQWIKATAPRAWLVLMGVLLASCMAVALPIWYWMIGRKYDELATMLRSGVDLFRFDMLRLLRLPAPRDPRQERQLWNAQQRLSSFGEEPDIRFERPAVEDNGGT